MKALNPVHDSVHGVDEVLHRSFLVQLQFMRVSNCFLLNIFTVVRFSVVLPEDAHVLIVHLAQGLLPRGQREEEIPFDLSPGVGQLFFQLSDASIGVVLYKIFVYLVKVYTNFSLFCLSLLYKY